MNRRKVIKVGAVAGVGLLSIPLPAAAIATSGSGSQPSAQIDPGWSLVEFSVSSGGGTTTNFGVGVENGTGASHTVIAKFYFDNSGMLQELAVTQSIFFPTGDSQWVSAVASDFVYVPGTYWVRLFVDGAMNVYAATIGFGTGV